MGALGMTKRKTLRWVTWFKKPLHVHDFVEKDIVTFHVPNIHRQKRRQRHAIQIQIASGMRFLIMCAINSSNLTDEKKSSLRFADKTATTTRAVLIGNQTRACGVAFMEELEKSWLVSFSNSAFPARWSCRACSLFPAAVRPVTATRRKADSSTKKNRGGTSQASLAVGTATASVVATKMSPSV